MADSKRTVLAIQRRLIVAASKREARRRPEEMKLIGAAIRGVKINRKIKATKEMGECSEK